MKIELDINNLAEQIKVGKSLIGKDGTLSTLVKLFKKEEKSVGN